LPVREYFLLPAISNRHYKVGGTVGFNRNILPEFGLLRKCAPDNTPFHP
jgi:hypothetical protein